MLDVIESRIRIWWKYLLLNIEHSFGDGVYFAFVPFRPSGADDCDRRILRFSRRTWWLEHIGEHMAHMLCVQHVCHTLAPHSLTALLALPHIASLSLPPPLPTA